MKRWLLPSPNRGLIDAAFFMVTGIVVGWAQERHFVALEISATVISLVFIVPVVVSGWWLIARAFVVDPLRGYLVRRATGEGVYFRDGVMRRKPRRRAAKASVGPRSK